jgi:hypothetical protein
MSRKVLTTVEAVNRNVAKLATLCKILHNAISMVAINVK